MSRYFFICLCILLCGSCCKKRSCAGDELPRINLKFSGVWQNQTITVFTLENGKTDSAFISLDMNNPACQIFPMNDFDDANVGARKFIIRYGNKMDTIQHVAAAFNDLELVCNNGPGCGRKGNETVTVKKLVKFAFLCKGEIHFLRDTVHLSW